MDERLKKEAEEAAEEQGNRHACPVIRSMYPSKSRGEMAKEFAQLFSLGCNWMHARMQKELNKYQDIALRHTCLETAGVDNWEGYDIAMEEYRKALEGDNG